METWKEELQISEYWNKRKKRMIQGHEEVSLPILKLIFGFF